MAAVQCSMEESWDLVFTWLFFDLENTPEHCFRQSKPPLVAKVLSGLFFSGMPHLALSELDQRHFKAGVDTFGSLSRSSGSFVGWQQTLSRWGTSVIRACHQSMCTGEGGGGGVLGLQDSRGRWFVFNPLGPWRPNAWTSH